MEETIYKDSLRSRSYQLPLEVAWWSEIVGNSASLYIRPREVRIYFLSFLIHLFHLAWLLIPNPSDSKSWFQIVIPIRNSKSEFQIIIPNHPAGFQILLQSSCSHPTVDRFPNSIILSIISIRLLHCRSSRRWCAGAPCIFERVSWDALHLEKVCLDALQVQEGIEGCLAASAANN